MSVERQYSYYGTPLATGEDSLVTRSKKAAGLKDRAIDPQTGKLIRFHGAFTGGFSSGYFNTVSTKEGWAPSQFFSTRAQRSETLRQQPEDYMDEEDFSDQGIAPKRFQPTESYSLSNKTAGSGVRDELTTSLLEKTSLISFSNTSSIGFDLMRTMGWREGQGVGSVVRKSRDTNQEAKPETESLVENTDTRQINTDNIECEVNSGGESEGEIIEDIINKDPNPPADPNDYVIAPRDNKESFVAIKDDKMGLGYSGMRAPNSSLFSQHQTDNPFTACGDSDKITSLFGGTLNNPYDVGEPDSRAGRMEWYRQEPTSDDEDSSFGWTGGGEGLRLASFQQIGSLCCVIPPCKVKIPPNYVPAVAVVAKTTHATQVQPYTEQSAAARGQLLGVQKSQPKLQFDSSKLKFNPLIQSLSSRFVPAQLPDSATPTDQLSGLTTPKQEPKVPKQSKEILEWHPHRILCKRFNIPDPYPSSGLVGIPFRPERLTFSSLMLSMGGASESTGAKETSDTAGDTVPWCPTSSDHLPSSDQRPPIDLFTSVFGGESSSESEGEGEARPAEEGTKQTSEEEKAPSESRNSLQVLAQMASKEIEKKRILEEKKRKKKSKFVEADEMEGDTLPKFSLLKAFGSDLPPDMFAPRTSVEDSPEHRSNHRDERGYKRRERDKDRKYSSRYSSTHYDKKYHNYSSSTSHRRK